MLKYRSSSTNRKGLTRRSYTSKYSNIYKYKKNNREVLSSFGFRTINKDFSDTLNFLDEKINGMKDKMERNNFPQ